MSTLPPLPADAPARAPQHVAAQPHAREPAREWLAAEKARGLDAIALCRTEAAKRRERTRRQLRAAHAKLDAIEAAERASRTRQRQAGKVRAPIGNPMALARARGKAAKATSGRGA